MPEESEAFTRKRRVDLRLAAAATARADRLTQAILAEAFRGELVPTEAELARREGRAFDPAGELLERIGVSPTVAAVAGVMHKRQSGGRL